MDVIAGVVNSGGGGSDATGVREMQWNSHTSQTGFLNLPEIFGH
jgi:hypothetical protein